MGKELATYPSKSHPGKVYTITEPNGGGDPYCDCWGWKRNRTCQHLDRFHSIGKRIGKHSIKAEPQEYSYTELKVKQKKSEYVETDFDKQISDAVNNVINRSG